MKDIVLQFKNFLNRQRTEESEKRELLNDLIDLVGKYGKTPCASYIEGKCVKIEMVLEVRFDKRNDSGN